MLTFCSRIKITEEVAEAFHFDEFLSHLRIQGLTADTQLYYMRYIHHFIIILSFGKCEDFDNFIKVKFAYFNLFNIEIANNTIYKHYKCIKKYCDFLRQAGLLNRYTLTKYSELRQLTPYQKH